VGANTDDFPRPNGVAEWVGTVVGLLLAIVLAVIGAVVLLAVASAAFGLILLPVVLLSDEPWWWAWLIGVGLVIGMLLLVGIALTVGHLVDRRGEAEEEGKSFADGRPLRRRASYRNRLIHAGLLVALLGYAAATEEILLALVVGILVALDVMGIAARRLASAYRKRTADAVPPPPPQDT
jgi:hypothetical protein